MICSGQDGSGFLAGSDVNAATLGARQNDGNCGTANGNAAPLRTAPSSTVNNIITAPITTANAS